LTAFTINGGATTNFESLASPSVNATLDSYALSVDTTLLIDTDTYCCTNRLAASGSIDTVTFTGQGGRVLIDGRNVYHVAYTVGSGNVPAIGTTISQGGVTGYFLGVWAAWTGENTVSGSAMPAAGFIKFKTLAGGNFAAGALTGITATCSGQQVRSWIEVRGADTALWTVPRIGAVEVQGDWLELGTTTGVAGQIVPFPTCATSAGTAPGVWIETAIGSGVYEQYAGVGSQVAVSTTRTTAENKLVWHTTTGWRIGYNGTNNVGYLPTTGRKIRMPNVFMHCCTRSVSGSGPRVLPSTTNTQSATSPSSTRTEMGTQGAGDIIINCANYYWSAVWSQAYRCDLTNSGFNDYIYLSEIASPLNISNCIVSPNQTAISYAAVTLNSCFAGGTVSNLVAWAFGLTASGRYAAIINYVTGVTFNNCVFGSLLLRGNANTGLITSTQAVNCTFNSHTNIGGRGLFIGAQNCTFNNQTYYDHNITTTTTSTNPMYALDFTTGGNGITVVGWSMPLSANGPYAGLVSVNACYNVLVKQIGTSTVAPLAMNNAVTGVAINGAGNNDTVTMKRVWLSGARLGPYVFVNSDTNILIENCMGDYADTTVQPGLNALMKNVGITSATTGQQSCYGTHWITRFLTTTSGFTEILCNEPTTASAAQCWTSGGVPQFNSSGSVLLTKVGDSVTWEMPFFAVGYTAFTNAAPTITGTNVTFGTIWGNHNIEFQVDTGSGYGGTWLNLTATNLIAQTFNSTTGFKLKIRATCSIAAATNVITNMRVAMTTTSNDQRDQNYPLSVNTVVVEGLITGSRVKATQVVGGTLIANLAETGGTATFTTEYAGAIAIEARKASGTPYYLPWNTQVNPVSGGTVTATALQQLDE
jgi:hypothetical protein